MPVGQSGRKWYHFSCVVHEKLNPKYLNKRLNIKSKADPVVQKDMSPSCINAHACEERQSIVLKGMSPSRI